MKTIAVLVFDLVNNYNHTVVDGIVSFFDDKPDFKLLVAPVRIPHSQNDNYDYQYWSSATLLQSNQVDGIILIPNSFTSYIDFDKLSKELEMYSGKPVVSISRKIDLPGSKYTYNTSAYAYDLVIEHLKNKHNCKRIAFFGAELTDSQESLERFDSFKKALKKNNLEFYPELVFQGDFTPGTAEEILAKKIKSKEDLNFDAICCVNDFTAGGVLYHFEKINVSCPNDVVIVGYDDSDYAVKLFPKLTTINQSVMQTGSKAAELLYRTLKGEKTEESIHTDSFPIYRQSCGCVDCVNFSSAYYDHLGNFYEKDINRQKAEVSSIKKHQRHLLDIYDIVNLINCNIPMEKVDAVLKSAMKLSKFSGIEVYFYPTPLELNSEDNFNIPDYSMLQIKSNMDFDELTISSYNEGEKVYLNQELFTSDDAGGGLNYFYPVFLGRKNYGYMICKPSEKEYIVSSINMKIISDILVNAFECSVQNNHQKMLMERNENLSMSAKTDELTKLFNRRGFMEYGQRLIEMSTMSDKTGCVFFFDLDGLKTINDTWGHDIGDLAIKTEAEVLKLAFRTADMIGRLSGDEFAVVAPGFSDKYEETIRERLISINKDLSEKENLPFTLSISFGVVTFDSDNANLVSLLKTADMRLYEEKMKKHPDRKWNR